MPTTAEIQAARFMGPLWAAILSAGGPWPETPVYKYYPDVYDVGWLASLPVPIDDNKTPEQPIALADTDGVGVFEQHISLDALITAYENRRRTRVYPSVNAHNPTAWYSIVARHLGNISQCDRAVVCAIYQSNAGDESLVPHVDSWYGAIVQLAGSKRWHFGEDVSDIITRAGGVMLMSKKVVHSAITPAEPGLSVHMTFAIDLDPKIDTR